MRIDAHRGPTVDPYKRCCLNTFDFRQHMHKVCEAHKSNKATTLAHLSRRKYSAQPLVGRPRLMEHVSVSDLQYH